MPTEGQTILKEKVAIVTGSSRGIGKAIAIALAEQGADVVINYCHSKEKAEEVARKLKQMGRKSFAFKADVSNEEEVNKMVEATLENFCKIDILVNNAGISENALSWEMQTELWNDILKVNLYGVFYCTRAVLAHMRERRQGRIINISSITGQIGVAGASAYAVSKAGVINFTKSVAREVAERGITVNVLGLGYFENGVLLTVPPDIRNNILSQIPMRRFGDPKSAAELVVYLCSDAADYITGQVIHINGGMYM